VTEEKKRELITADAVLLLALLAQWRHCYYDTGTSALWVIVKSTNAHYVQLGKDNNHSTMKFLQINTMTNTCN